MGVETEEQWTCGKGIAWNAVLPGTLAPLMGTMAEMLERHTDALDGSDPQGKAEADAYMSLVTAHRSIADALSQLQQQMAGYRDLPMAKHDTAVMQDPNGQAEAYRRLLKVKSELVVLLKSQLEEAEAS